jgi:hypothetical protein
MEGNMKTTRKSSARAKVMATTSPAAEPLAPERAMPTKRDIAGRAYELYTKSGYQAGREVEFWLEAERQLQSGRRK